MATELYYMVTDWSSGDSSPLHLESMATDLSALKEVYNLMVDSETHSEVQQLH